MSRRFRGCRVIVKLSGIYFTNLHTTSAAGCFPVVSGLQCKLSCLYKTGKRRGGGVNGVPCRQRAWWRALCNPASLSSRRRPRDVRQPRKLDVRGIPGGSGSICLNILASKPLTPHPIFSCVSHGLRTKPLGFITFLVKDFFDLNKHEISSEHSGLVLTMLDEFALI